MKRWLAALALILFAIPLAPAHGAETEDLLDPEQAFTLTVTARDTDALVADWEIAEGYYLYRERMRFESGTPGIRLNEPRYPQGKVKEDEFFGKMEIYRHRVTVEIPLVREAGAPARLELKAVSQGCADIGVCYPPQTQNVAVDLPAPGPGPLAALSESRQSLSAGTDPGQEELLDPDQAYILSLTAPDPATLVATWTIAPGYYLYKDKLKLSLADAPGVSIGSIDLPPGEPKEDEFFGRQEVFHNEIKAIVHLKRDHPGTRDIKVQASYQGCAEIGVCYPPITHTIPVILPALAASAQAATGAQPPQGMSASRPAAQPRTAAKTTEAEEESRESEQDVIARRLREGGYHAMPLFFGFGLLLAFTPCIFPMIPILSCLIVGQGENITRWQGFILSLVYVLAMAVTYTIAGVLAALLGQNIQAMFQNPLILSGFSLIFVLLALSMFGFYDLQLPASWQSRLTELSNRQSGGSYVGVAIMGLFSALIVGPCVAPPLIGVLAVIGASGDAMLGGTALFVMSLGMGAPLLAIGASAGHFLPRAGHWMDRVKTVFGVLLLGVAIWMLERILPEAVSMLLWAVLLIISATYMGALQSLSNEKASWQTLVRGLGIVMLCYGILLLVGVAAGGRDPLQPLRGVGLVAAGGGTVQEHPSFKTIKTVADLERELRQARGRPVVLDFYADWCVSCKEMEKYTFSDPAVQAAWSGAVLLRADVTANDTADKELLRHFGIIGPPALLFFGPDGIERPAYRVVGFMPQDTFKNHLEQALRS